MSTKAYSVALSILTGLSVGSAIVLLSKWWNRRNSASNPKEATLRMLVEEVKKLRELMLETKEQLESLRRITVGGSKSSVRPVDAESEYLSTYESIGDGEDEFYDFPSEELDRR